MISISKIIIKRDYFQGLEDAGQYVDHLYIQFYNNYCHTGAGKWFTDTLKKWLAFSARMKPSGPLIFIGMPAATRAASGAQYYRPPAELTKMYQVCSKQTFTYILSCQGYQTYHKICIYDPISIHEIIILIRQNRTFKWKSNQPFLDIFSNSMNFTSSYSIS